MERSHIGASNQSWKSKRVISDILRRKGWFLGMILVQIAMVHNNFWICMEFRHVGAERGVSWEGDEFDTYR